MKLSKILMTVAAISLLAGLSSCKMSEDEEKSINGEKIEYTHNGSKEYFRSFVATATKHYSANANIVIQDVKNTDLDSKAGLGFVFGIKKNLKEQIKLKDSNDTMKTVFYDFGIASVRYNKTKNKVQWYVSWCENVPETVFNYNDESAFTDNKTFDRSYGTEVQIVPTSGYWKDVSMDLNGKNLEATIKVVANEDGSYKVSLCKSDKENTEIESATISKDITKFNKKTQRFIGRYLTLYKNQTVKGTIKYSDVAGNLIPADYDVIEE